MENESKAMSTKELTAAVHRLLEIEEQRALKAERRRRKRVHDRREKIESNIAELGEAIKVIKWCIIAITTYLGLAFIVLVWVVLQVRSEAQRISGEVEQIRGRAEKMVEQIEDEADKIRDKIQNPLRSIGGAIGGRLDQRIGDALGIDE